jgi:hypothetical protein
VLRSVHASLALVVLVACETPPAEELIQLKVRTVALVDVACELDTGVCQGDEVVDAALIFDAGISVVQSSVDFLQYEVEVDFGEGLPAPPVYGGPIQLNVTSGTQRNFALRTAGLEQRQFVSAYFPQTRMEGKGRVTLYGYDQKNNIVTVKAPFDVVFDDFLGGGDTTAP